MLTMLAAVAETERDLLVERTQAGLECPKAEGKTLGRPVKTTLEQRTSIRQVHSKGTSISALARQFNMPRPRYQMVNVAVRPKAAGRQNALKVRYAC